MSIGNTIISLYLETSYDVLVIAMSICNMMLSSCYETEYYMLVITKLIANTIFSFNYKLCSIFDTHKSKIFKNFFSVASVVVDLLEVL